MSRPTAVSIAVSLLVWLCAGAVSAPTSTGGTTTVTALAGTDFTISVQTKNAGGSWTQLDSEDAKTFFGRGRSECGNTVRFDLELASATVEAKIR